MLILALLGVCSLAGKMRSVVRRRRPVQTCKKTCDGDSCIGPGVCGGFTIRVCRDSMNCSREGACHDVSIDDVFLACENTEACYYAGNRGETTRGWCGGAPASCVRPGNRVRRRDREDHGRTGQGVGRRHGDGRGTGHRDLAEGLVDELVERRRA